MKKILFIAICSLASTSIFAQAEKKQSTDQQERLAWQAKLEMIQAEDAQLQKNHLPAQQPVQQKAAQTELQRNDGVDPAMKPKKVENIDPAMKSRAVLLPNDQEDLQRREKAMKE